MLEKGIFRSGGIGRGGRWSGRREKKRQERSITYASIRDIVSVSREYGAFNEGGITPPIRPAVSIPSIMINRTISPR